MPFVGFLFTRLFLVCVLLITFYGFFCFGLFLFALLGGFPARSIGLLLLIGKGKARQTGKAHGDQRKLKWNAHEWTPEFL